MPPTRNLTRVILAASAGNALEFFDFTVFAAFVPQISDAFFPAHSATDSLLYTWGTYATAFVARPLGALVLGSYADRVGRRAAMTLAIALMTLGTAMVAFMPRYDSIGILAPLGILLARILQGFSTGGEFGGATAFMLEHSTNRRGFMASFQFTSQAISNLAGSLVAVATASLMSAGALHAWGFRIPFMIGLLIGPVGYWLRRETEETPVFQHSAHSKRPAVLVLWTYPVRILLAATTICAGTAGTYLALYLPTYAQTELHMPASSSLALPILGNLVALGVTPLVAAYSDRATRIMPSIVGVVLLMLLAVPSFSLISAAPGFVMVALVAAVLTAVRSSYSAPIPALLGELFPAAVRGVGMSVSYSLGVMLFGSLTPFVNTWAVHATGWKGFPGAWLAVCCAVTLGGLLAIRKMYVLERD